MTYFFFLGASARSKKDEMQDMADAELAKIEE
jgi:hypothetical protein